MKITILTPSYNQAMFIEDNIQSVMKQDYVDIEHIIIDGGSEDDTVSILKKHPHLRWISKRDRGQSDALQKGLEMASGDIIGWINSDDYLEDNVLKRVATIFETEPAAWIIGNITFLYEPDQRTAAHKSQTITKQRLFSNPDILRQQGTFFKREALIQAGGFNPKYHLVMDLDLWFRMLNISRPKMVDENFAYFRIHKDQKTSGKLMSQQRNEILEVFRKNNAPIYYQTKLYLRKVICAFKISIKNVLER